MTNVASMSASCHSRPVDATSPNWPACRRSADQAGAEDGAGFDVDDEPEDDPFEPDDPDPVEESDDPEPALAEASEEEPFVLAVGSPPEDFAASPAPDFALSRLSLR